MDIPPEKILRKERLYPGKMLLVDTVQGRIISDEEVKNYYAAQAPYGEWLEDQLLELSALGMHTITALGKSIPDIKRNSNVLSNIAESLVQ